MDVRDDVTVSTYMEFWDDVKLSSYINFWDEAKLLRTYIHVHDDAKLLNVPKLVVHEDTILLREPTWISATKLY